MTKNPHFSTGFTLIELLVVVLIIGVLAAMGMTQFSKTMEIAKAEDAVATTRAVANANRMYALDHGGVYLAGDLSACNPSGASATCNGVAASVCDLMYCGYLVRQDLSTLPTGPKSYVFRAANGADRVAATASRLGEANAPYNTWQFSVTRDGVVAKSGTETPDIK